MTRFSNNRRSALFYETVKAVNSSSAQNHCCAVKKFCELSEYSPNDAKYNVRGTFADLAKPKRPGGLFRAETAEQTSPARRLFGSDKYRTPEIAGESGKGA